MFTPSTLPQKEFKVFLGKRRRSFASLRMTKWGVTPTRICEGSSLNRGGELTLLQLHPKTNLNNSFIIDKLLEILYTMLVSKKVM
jgi:hypothetical protein